MALINTAIRFTANGGETRVIGNQTIRVPSNGGFYDRTLRFRDGTGLNKSQRWASIAISLAAGASTTIDLTAITAAQGATGTVNYSNIKTLILENTNTEQEAGTVTITGTPTGGPYTMILATSLGALTTTASGASLTGGSTPAATYARLPSNLVLGDDGTGSNVWAAPFLGTNARLNCQPGETIGKSTSTVGGYAVSGSSKSLLIKNVGAVAAAGVLLLCGEGS